MTAIMVDKAVTPTSGRAPKGRPGGSLLTAIRTNRKAMVGFVIFVFFCVAAAVAQLFTSVRDPQLRAFDVSLGSSREHLLGTTAFGQDVFAQLIYGTRQSLVIALVAGVFATALSVLIGVSAGYLGGVGGGILSLILGVFIIVLVITGLSYGARQLHSQTLSLRNRDFLESARVRGERRSYIILVEVLPTLTSLILASFLGAALYAVLTAAGLQFLGLGDPSSASWGTMLYWSQSQSALQTDQVWWAIAPGLCVALLGASFALLNYAFDEISNPALRPVRRTRVKRTHP